MTLYNCKQIPHSVCTALLTVTNDWCILIWSTKLIWPLFASSRYYSARCPLLNRSIEARSVCTWCRLCLLLPIKIHWPAMVLTGHALALSGVSATAVLPNGLHWPTAPVRTTERACQPDCISLLFACCLSFERVPLEGALQPL